MQEFWYGLMTGGVIATVKIDAGEAMDWWFEHHQDAKRLGSVNHYVSPFPVPCLPFEIIKLISHNIVAKASQPRALLALFDVHHNLGELSKQAADSLREDSTDQEYDYDEEKINRRVTLIGEVMYNLMLLQPITGNEWWGKVLDAMRYDGYQTYPYFALDYVVPGAWMSHKTKADTRWEDQSRLDTQTSHYFVPEKLNIWIERKMKPEVFSPLCDNLRIPPVELKNEFYPSTTCKRCEKILDKKVSATIPKFEGE